MSFWDSYKKVKGAVDTAYGETHDLGTVRVSGGFITATDSRMLACAPIDIDQTFAVSAPALERCFKRFGAPKVSAGAEFLTVSEGRKRARIQMLDVQQVQGLELQPELLEDAPAGIATACARLQVFMSDDQSRQTLCGVHFEDGKALATNGMIIGQLATETFKRSVTFPEWLVGYLVRREEAIVSAYVTDGQIAFKFEDGSYVVSARFATDMSSAQVCGVVEQNYRDPTMPLSAELREALTDAIDFAEDQIIIAPDAVKTEKGVTQFSSDIDTGLASETVWSPKPMTAMLSQATHFDPTAWPAPCSWMGSDIKGLIVGRR